MVNYQAYCDALNEQVAVHLGLLDQLSQLGSPGLLERTAAEHSLQVLAEAAIGMRNAIVHDYLNLDWALIQKVNDDRRFTRLGKIVEHCCSLLLGEKP